MASLTVETWQCAACGKESVTKLQCCGGCKSVYYCDAKCQQQHWNAGHKNECKTMKAQKSKEKFETRTEKGQLQLEEYNLKDARKNHKRALKAAEEIKDELGVASSYGYIGRTYFRQGKLNEALKYYNNGLDIRLNKLGKDHPHVATSYGNIGSVYAEQGNKDKALKYFNKALDIYLDKLGKDHPLVASSYNNIGSMYKEQGKKDEALKYLNKALDIEFDKLGKDHPDVAISYNNIGAIYAEQGKYDKAFEYYNKAFKIFKKRLGTSHSYTTDSLQSMIRIKKYFSRTKSL